MDNQLKWTMLDKWICDARDCELQLFPLILNLNGLDCFIRGVPCCLYKEAEIYCIHLLVMALESQGFPCRVAMEPPLSMMGYTPAFTSGSSSNMMQSVHNIATMLLHCERLSRMIAWSSGNVKCFIWLIMVLSQMPSLYVSLQWYYTPDKVDRLHYCNMLTHVCSLSGSGNGGTAGLFHSGVI